MAQEAKTITSPLRLVSDGNKAFTMLEVVNIGGAPLFQVFGDGSVKFHKEVGMNGSNPIGKGAALTAPVVAPASLTHTNPGADDFAFANGINASAWGFSSQNEFNSMLKTLKNAVTRIAELEARLVAAGIIS